MSSDEENGANMNYKVEYEKLEKAYKELQEFCEQQSSELFDLRTENDRVTDEKGQLEAKISILDSKVAQLSDEVEDHKKKEEDMEKQLGSASTESESARTKYDQLVSEISKLEEESETLRKENAELQSKASELEARLNGSDHLQSMDIYKAEDVDSIKKEHEELKEKYKLLYQKNEELYDQLRQAQKRESDLEDRLGTGMMGERADMKMVINPEEASFSSMNGLDDMLKQPDAQQEGKEAIDGDLESPSSNSSVNSLVDEERHRAISDHSDSSVNTLGSPMVLQDGEQLHQRASSFDSSNSSQNTLDRPGLDEKDEEINELKKEISEMKSKHQSQLLTIVVEMNKLRQKYVEIEQSI